MLPRAPAEWNFLDWISWLDREFIFSPFCAHYHTHSLPTAHPSVLTCNHWFVLAVTAVMTLRFHPSRPFAFGPLCAPFQFQSAPRWIQAILKTAECIELFCMATEEEKSAHQKKLSGASRQAETRIGQFTPREGVSHSCCTSVSAGCLCSVSIYSG